MSIYADSSLLISYCVTVTLAKKLKANAFFTFDARQKSLALALGLAVKP